MKERIIDAIKEELDVLKHMDLFTLSSLIFLFVVVAIVVIGSMFAKHSIKFESKHKITPIVQIDGQDTTYIYKFD